MGWTVDLVTGVAELLDAAGAGVWNPTGIYDVDDTAIVVGPTIPQTPDRIVCLTPYPVEDTPGLPEVVIAIQVRCRGTTVPRTAEDQADAVYDVLHGASGLTLGGVPVAQMWRQSSAPLGPDTSGRAERSDNYYLRAARSATYSTD